MNIVVFAGALLTLATACITHVCAVMVALFHPKKARRDAALAVLDRIPTPTLGRPRRRPSSPPETGQ